MSRKQRKNLIRILAATLLLVLFVLLPAEVYPLVFGIDCLRLAAFLIPYFIVGWDVLYTALRNLTGGRLLDEKFLMALATVGAFTLGEYVEGVAVMLLYQVGELFQSLAVGRSRKSIAALMNIRPDTATVLREGKAETVLPEEVAAGELLRILPGEKIPLDGTVTEGESQVNTAALTGESLPREVKAGDRVISGSVNMSGVLTVRAESPYAESTVAKILDLVENAAERKARVEAFITRFAHWYTPLVVGVALLLAVLPPIFGRNWGEWIGRALIFLVVSCPCALVISVPLSFFGGIGGASRRGILIKGAEYVEVLSRVHTVAFDKTGTLTEGRFRVSAVYPQNGIREEDLLALAASPVFRCLACVDRGERRAPQTWDIGGAWDELLSAGFHVSARCGSDFHGHFTTGGHDYFPGEFVQDCLQVEKNDYQSILNAYRNGNFYTMCGSLIAEPEFSVSADNSVRQCHLAFDLNGEMEKVEVISEGKIVAEFTDIPEHFEADFAVPDGKYYRVRGTGKMQKRKYTEGEFEPLFLLNPIYF